MQFASTIKNHRQVSYEEVQLVYHILWGKVNT